MGAAVVYRLAMGWDGLALWPWTADGGWTLLNRLGKKACIGHGMGEELAAGCWAMAARVGAGSPSRLLSRQIGEHSYLPTYLHTYVCMYYVLCIVLTYMHTRAACLLEEDE